MSQEDKELLFKDLCSRLPYGVKCINIRWPRDGHVEISNIDANRQKVQIFEDWCDINDCKPYLRPMSSMTDDEIFEQKSRMRHEGYFVNPLYFHTIEEFDYLDSIHVDYRGLIEKGLALEAPEGMYK